MQVVEVREFEISITARLEDLQKLRQAKAGQQIYEEVVIMRAIEEVLRNHGFNRVRVKMVLASFD